MSYHRRRRHSHGSRSTTGTNTVPSLPDVAYKKGNGDGSSSDQHDVSDVRRQNAFSIRQSAASLAATRPHARHIHANNSDEVTYGAVAMFTKGLPHSVATGLLLRNTDYRLLVAAIASGSSRDIRALPLGPPPVMMMYGGEEEGLPAVRKWQGMTAGLAYDLQGPDAQALMIPPAPRINSTELAFEMTELYWMALLRDVPFAEFDKAPLVQRAIAGMNKQPWIKHGSRYHRYQQEHYHQQEEEEQWKDDIAVDDGRHYGQEEEVDEDDDSFESLSSWSSFDSALHKQQQQHKKKKKHRQKTDESQSTGSPYDKYQTRRLRRSFSSRTAFRGVTRGDDVGPYISQFLLMGTAGVNSDTPLSTGYVQYGALRIDQRVRVATPRVDYMTAWDDFIDVQNGVNTTGNQRFESSPLPPSSCSGRSHRKDKVEFRFISTPRDLCTYVHYDVSYQPYYIATLILLSLKAPFDKGLPFQKKGGRQAGFVTFGAPHIVTLVAEATSRALKAACFQKYQVHRRIRPEAVGGLVERYHVACNREDECVRRMFAFVHPLHTLLQNRDRYLLSSVAEHNTHLNKWAAAQVNCATGNGSRKHKRSSSTKSHSSGNNHHHTVLLPQAYPEGSPMHPSYSAGHATVAGACTTVLKAFFDTDWILPQAFVPSADGTRLSAWRGGEWMDRKGCKRKCRVSVEGELNKLCSNISIGRNWAGVHYFSDYFESIVLGEQLAIQLLEEQKLTQWEKGSMTLHKFDGSVVKL